MAGDPGRESFLGIDCRSQTAAATAFLSPEKLVEVVNYVHDWLYESEPGKRRRPSLIKRALGRWVERGSHLSCLPGFVRIRKKLEEPDFQS